MTQAAFLGAAAGAAMAVLAFTLFPARPSLAAELGRLHRQRPLLSSPALVVTVPGPSQWLVRVAALVGIERLVGPSLRNDLRVLGRGLEEHLARRALLGLAGLAAGPVTGALLWLLAPGAALAVPAALSLVLATVGVLVPSFGLRAEAQARRRGFRHAFGAFLDVVSVSLAAGRGVESALLAGARAGRGWAFAELRDALFTAQRSGETPWDGLDRLGLALAVPELQELAASAALAGEEGATVRHSVAAKATALRARALAEAEAAAESASERMSVPTVMLLVGFVIFVGYPAVAGVTGL